MSRILLILLALFYISGKAASQVGINFLWAKTNPPQLLGTPYWVGGPNFNQAIKVGSRVHFFDGIFWDPFVFKMKNGDMDPFVLNSYIDNGWCNVGSGSFLKPFYTSSFMLTRSHLYYGWPWGISVGILRNGNFQSNSFLENSGFSACNNLFQFTSERSGKIYQFFEGDKEGPFISTFMCNSGPREFHFNCFNSNLDLVYSLKEVISGNPFSTPILCFSQDHKPILSFRNSGSFVFQGITYTAIQDGFTRLVLNEDGQVHHHYHMPFSEGSDFFSRFQFVDGGDGIQFGQKLINDSTYFGEIHLLDSLGNEKWAIRDSTIRNFVSAIPDKAGNTLFRFTGIPNQTQDGLLIVSPLGQKIKEIRFPPTTKIENLTWFEGIDTLQWALGGQFSSSNLIVGNDTLIKTYPNQVWEQSFISVIGIPETTVQPYLSFNCGDSFCPGAKFKLLVEDQGNLHDSTNRFVVELSDEAGSFTNPFIIDSSRIVTKNVHIPDGLTSGSQYKIRIRSTNPSAIGPEKTIQILNGPKLPVITSENGFQFCDGRSLTLNVSQPEAGVVYNWSNGQPGSSIEINSTDSVWVMAKMGSCLNRSATVSPEKKPSNLWLLNNSSICGDHPGVQFQTSIPGGFWTGPQIDTFGNFHPVNILDTLHIRYQIPGYACRMDSTFTIVQLKRPLLTPVSDTIICGSGITFSLHNQGLGNTESWSGSYVSGGFNFTPAQEGIFQLIHSAGHWMCRSTDSVQIKVRNLDHPFCKSELLPLSDLQVLVESVPCSQSNVKIWAHWPSYEEDSLRPFQLQIADSSGNFSSPLFTREQPIPFFKQTLNLASGYYQIRINKTNPLVVGESKLVLLSKTPPKPIISTIGPKVYCKEDSIHTILHVSPVSGVTHRWNISGFEGDTFVINSTGNYTVKGYSFECESQNSLPVSITRKFYPNIKFYPPSLICTPDSATVLISNQPGIWTGPNVDSTTGKYFPQFSSNDTAIVNYKFLYNGCWGHYTMAIPQRSRPSVSTQGDFSTCTNLAPVSLNGYPFLGIWSGPGVLTDNYFHSVVPGNFSIFYTYSDGVCSNTEVDQITVYDPENCLVSSSPNSKISDLKIWPNPAKNFIQISGLKYENSDIQVFNSFGQLVYKNQILNHQLGFPYQFSLPGQLAVGIYRLLILQKNEAPQYFSLILER